MLIRICSAMALVIIIIGCSNSQSVISGSKNNSLSQSTMTFGSWKRQESGVSSKLNDVFFINEASGWAVGEGGAIISTNDGGSTWQAKVAGKFSWWSLKGLFFTAPRNGCIVGREEFAAILTTADNGQRFNRHFRGGPGSLNSVFFADTLNGWAVGTQGVIVHTSDGGLTWKPQVSEFRSNLHQVFFVNSQLGWIVGEQGNILHTNNGGQKWGLQSSPSKSQLRDVRFLDDKIGWSVGDQGTILHTKDSGRSWSLQNSGVQLNLSSLFFINQDIGWAVGSDGLILLTQDAGQTWLPQTSGVSSDLLSVNFVKKSGWVVGNGGVILHYKAD